MGECGDMWKKAIGRSLEVAQEALDDRTEEDFDDSPESCVGLIAGGATISELAKIRTFIMDQPSVEWMELFIDLGGLDVLLQILQRRYRGDVFHQDTFTQIESVQCIRAVINSTAGITCLASNQDLVTKLVRGRLSFRSGIIQTFRSEIRPKSGKSRVSCSRHSI